jgi:hypothetical protein
MELQMKLKLFARGVMTIATLALFSLTGSSTMAQDYIRQQLEVSKIYSVREIEPGVVEIVTILRDGSKTALRIDIFTVRLLAAQLNRFSM